LNVIAFCAGRMRLAVGAEVETLGPEWQPRPRDRP
jgi:hypothetical protein